MPTLITSYRKPYALYRYSQWDGYPPTILNTSGTYNLGSRTKVTASDPLWRDKVSKGLEATLGYTLKGFTDECRLPIFKGSDSSVNSDGSHGSSNATFVLSNLNWALPAFPTDIALRDVALARFKRKIQSQIGAHDTLVPVAELRELRGLITSMAQVTTKALPTFLLPKKYKAIRDMIKYLQNTWLTYSFGLKPTVMAAQDACDAIINYLERNDKTIRLASGANKVWTSSVQHTAESTFLNSANAFSDIVHRHTLSYRYVGGFNFELLSSNDYNVGKVFQLGPENIPSVLYELTPFSWVIDYFTTMGQFVDDTFVVPPGSTKYIVLNSLYVRETTERWGYRQLDVPNRSSHVNIHKNVPGFYNYFEFRRERVGALPRIGLHFKSIDAVAKNSVSKLLNLASILKPR